VIVCADEESLKFLGRWPWPRNVHAKLVDRLTRAGAKAIVFDVLFLNQTWTGLRRTSVSRRP